jgi:hypothetical protein
MRVRERHRKGRSTKLVLKLHYFRAMTSKRGAPQAVLIAMTPEAQAALGDRKEIRIHHFPFKVGRESRLGTMNRIKNELERRLGGAPQLNYLYLLDPQSPLLHISREHFLIDWIDERFVLIDRESACGTRVAGKALGVDGPDQYADLNDGDTIVVGSAHSPFVFQFRIGKS